jgi:hypothetical protein
VERSSPQGDLQLVGIRAGLVALDLHELRGAGAADHHAGLVERADARRQRLIHDADRIEAVREHGREQEAADIGERKGHGQSPWRIKAPACDRLPALVSA